MARKRVKLVLALLVSSSLSGCLFPVRERVDSEICHRAELPVDQDQRAPAPSPLPLSPAAGERGRGEAAAPSLAGVPNRSEFDTGPLSVNDPGVRPAAAQQPAGKPEKREDVWDRLSLMEKRIFGAGKDVPYSDVPLIKFVDPTSPPKVIAAAGG